ncbi:hypothetical protein [Enterococcus rotai]|uniref:hypothetical protein n=1 Tax=Enterococcus rotai TaxID=118060 RepID=UPI0032B32EC6
MKNIKKVKIWLAVSLVIVGLGVVGWLNSANSSVRANSDKTEQTESKDILAPVKNDVGLSATAKSLIISQNEEFPILTTKAGRQQLFSKQTFPNSEKDSSYEYSDAKGNTKKPNSETVGFQLIYVKVSDNSSKSNILVPIPVTVTSSGTSLLAENQVAFQQDDEQEEILLQLNEVKDKNEEELKQLVKEKANVRAWRTDNGEALSIVISETTIDPSLAGVYKATFEVTVGEEKVQTEKEVQIVETTKTLNPAPRAGDDGVVWELQSAYKRVSISTPYGWFYMNNGDLSTAGSMYSYPTMSINRADLVWSKAGYSVNLGYPSLFGGRGVGAVTLIPTENGKLLPSLDEQEKQLTLQTYKSSDGKRVKEEVENKTLGLKYTMEASLNSVNSYRVQTKIENTTPNTRNLGFFNKGVLSSYSGYTGDKGTQLYSIGNGRGANGLVKIYFNDIGEYEIGFGIDFKPRVDDPYKYWDVRNEFNDLTWIDLNTTAMRSGMEKNRIPAGEPIFNTIARDFPFSAGVPEKALASGESISATWDLTYGDIPPYLTLDVKPKEYNVYQDTTVQNFDYGYTIGNIPTVNDSGTISATFPDGSQEEKTFTGTNNKGSFTVTRNKLPKRLNDVPGTIKYYESILLAKNNAVNGLPSEDTYLSINVYNLGGTPITQMVKKDSVWNKKADTLIKDPVILPGHKATLDYVNPEKKVDTSKVGMQTVEVLMTDTNEPTRTTIIKVPVYVYEGTLPTTGLMIGANDFSIEKEALAGLTDAQLKETILNKSNAVAWDLETGLSDEIDLSVSAMTLTNTPEAGKKYTATIKATKYGVTKEAKINIAVTGKAELKIQFVDENNEMLSSLALMKEVGIPVDLSKETEVINVLKELDADKRVLEERPINETSYPIANTNEIVTYRFRSNASLVVTFGNVEEDEVLSPDIVLTKRIGTLVNLQEEPEVVATVKHLRDEKYYELYSYPSNEEAYEVTTAAEQTVSYTFDVQSRLNVQFIDEENNILDNLFLFRRIGSLDLSKDADILTAIKKLEEQHYEVIKRPLNETEYPIRPETEIAVYQVKKTEVAVKIRFVDEDGIDITKVEAINSTGIIGTNFDLLPLDTEIKKRLKVLEDEHYELVESPVNNQIVTESLELFYRFKGSLFIGSFPEILNFGDKYLNSSIIKGEQPKYDKDLVIKDTRKNNKGSWKLLATLEKPLTSADNPSEIINNVFYYRQDAGTRRPLLKGQALPIEAGVATTSGEYNISEKWTSNKTGLELDVYSHKVYQTGKYTASILWQVETTP